MYRQMSAYGWSVCNGKANRILIIAECASPTPLESLIPDVLFVPNEIEVLDRLHVGQHPSGRGEFAAHELRLSRSESLPAHDDVVVTSSSSLTDMPALLPCCMHSRINRMNLINRWSNLGIFKCRRFESHYFIKKRPVPKNCTRSNEFARVLFRVAPPNSL